MAASHRVMCHVSKLKSSGFLEHESKFTTLKWLPESANLNPTEHHRDVVKWGICVMKNRQHLYDVDELWFSSLS